MTTCRNTHYAHECHPHYAKKYDGYCLDCANAGVPELVERIAKVGELTEIAELAVRLPCIRTRKINWGDDEELCINPDCIACRADRFFEFENPDPVRQSR